MSGNISIACRDLSVSLGEQPVLNGISIDIRRGAWTTIVGPNGAGKSTLLKALAGLLPAQGLVQWDGRALAGWTRRERALNLAWLGQGEEASDDLSVFDLVMLGRLPHQSWWGAASQADERAVFAALDATEAAGLRARTMATLSGGERQRVLLARALAVEAPVLFMDEPLVNLDPPHQAAWLQLVRRLVGEGRTVVSVLHEISTALHADDVIVIERGKVRHHGERDDAATHAAMQDVFDRCFTIHSLAGQWVALPHV